MAGSCQCPAHATHGNIFPFVFLTSTYPPPGSISFSANPLRRPRFSVPSSHHPQPTLADLNNKKKRLAPSSGLPCLIDEEQHSPHGTPPPPSSTVLMTATRQNFIGMRFQFPFLACFHELTLAVTCWAMPHVQATWQAEWSAVCMAQVMT